eukprot:1308996-Prymnesium_polylepis.1
MDCPRSSVAAHTPRAPQCLWAPHMDVPAPVARAARNAHTSSLSHRFHVCCVRIPQCSRLAHAR